MNKFMKRLGTKDPKRDWWKTGSNQREAGTAKRKRQIMEMQEPMIVCGLEKSHIISAWSLMSLTPCRTVASFGSEFCVFSPSAPSSLISMSWVSGVALCLCALDGRGARFSHCRLGTADLCSRWSAGDAGELSLTGNDLNAVVTHSIHRISARAIHRVPRYDEVLMWDMARALSNLQKLKLHREAVP
jgi:hypothetical protein